MDHLKNFFKQIVVLIIQAEAKLVLKKYKPKIVGITGSVGKTSTKDAVATVLAVEHSVRGSAKSFNSDFGVPLTILNCPTAWSNPIGWLKNIVHGLELIIFTKKYPEWLVLEVGADRPGDIKKIAAWLPLDVAVFTRIPDVPAHVEFFPSVADVIAEKSSLLDGLKSDGVLVINADDPNLLAISQNAKQRQITYGFNRGATVFGSHEHIMYNEGDERRLPDGMACQVEYEGSSVPLRLPGVLGKHQLYVALAAFAVGVSQGINPAKIVESLAVAKMSPGRLRLIPGIKDSLILDDTYNASPVAVEAALQTLASFETSGRKIVAIGDMLELGEHTVEEHKKVGVLAAGFADLIIAVGLRSKFILEGALAAGYNPDQVKHFDTSSAAGEWLQNEIFANDIILVKGSQSIRMEKLVEEVMLEPDLKEKLLCRQDIEWQKR